VSAQVLSASQFYKFHIKSKLIYGENYSNTFREVLVEFFRNKIRLNHRLKQKKDATGFTTLESSLITQVACSLACPGRWGVSERKHNKAVEPCGVVDDL